MAATTSRAWIPIVAAVCTAASLLVMLPRLLDAHFGLLDDGVILALAKQIAATPSRAFTIGVEHGRFVPAFWLFNTGVYCLVGQSATGFYVANLLILCSLITGIVLLVRAAGGTPTEASLAGALLLGSGAIVEAFYTLSKPEPLQALCLVGAIYFALIAARWDPRSIRVVVNAAASGACLLLATFLKETTVVLLPIIAAWIGASVLVHPWRARWERRVLLVLLGGALVSVSAFLLSRAFVLPATITGSYAANFDVSIDRIVASMHRWGVWLLHDYLHVLLLAVFVLPFLRGASRTQKQLLAAAAIWMAGWVAIYLPWHSQLQYYLLPFAIGAAVFCASALGVLLSVARTVTSAPGRIVRYVALPALCIVLACNFLNNRTQAIVQLIQDRSNAALITYLSTLPERSAVLLNLQEPNEYEIEIGVHLRGLRARSDVTVEYFRPAAVGAPSSRPRYVASPIVENQFSPAVRMAVFEGAAREWSHALDALIGDSADVWKVQSSARLIDIGFHRLPATILRRRWSTPSHEGTPRRIIDARTFVYGWRVSVLPNR